MEEDTSQPEDFGSLLKKLGFDLVTDTNQYRLLSSMDICANLVRHVRSGRLALNDFISGPENSIQGENDCLQLFILSFAGLESHLSDEANLLNSLKSSILIYSNSPSQVPSHHGDSLVTILLKINVVQPHLIRILFEKMPEYFDRDCEIRSEECISKLIIHRLRWLDNLRKESDLTNKLIDILEIAPSTLKRDIILALPDIVSDSEHQLLLPALQSIIDADSGCTNAVGTLSKSFSIFKYSYLAKFEAWNPTCFAFSIKSQLRLSFLSPFQTRVFYIMTAYVRSDIGYPFKSLRRTCVSGRRDRKGTTESLAIRNWAVGLIRFLLSAFIPQNHRFHPLSYSTAPNNVSIVTSIAFIACCVCFGWAR
jgi:hypothetical protein